MKKFISLIVLLIVIALCLPVYADTLQNVTINIDKSLQCIQMKQLK